MLAILSRHQRTISTFFFLSVIALLSACGGGSSSSNNPITAQSIVVSPQTAQFAKGTNQQFTAVVRFSNGATQNLSDTVSWTSSNESVASINASGLASGLSVGATRISATYQGVTGTTDTDTITVTDAVMTALQVSPQDTTIAKGLSKQYNATGIFSDASHQDVTASAQWSSSKPSIAEISVSGLASTKAVGDSEISASHSGFTDSANISVDAAVLQQIDLSPTSATIANGLTKQFTATGAYSDGSHANISNDVTWVSTDTTHLVVDATGLATAKATGGPITVNASLEGITGSAAITVSDAVLTDLSVSPASASIPKGRDQQFVATGTYSDGSIANISSTVNWSSADTSAIAIDAQGLATAKALSTDIVITASLNSFESSAAMSVTAATLERVNVAPSNTTIPNGTSQQYTAKGIYSDNSNLDISNSVTWLSSDRSIADISNVDGNQGYAIGRQPGAVEISASLDGVMGKTALTVSEAELRAIQVSPNGQRLANGFQRQYTATGFYTDGSNKQINEMVNWESSNAALAPVDNSDGKKGMVQAANTGTGTVSIRASSTGISGFASLNVTAATIDTITLSPSNPSIALDPDTRLPFSATGNFSDGSQLDITQQVTWSSGSELIASISNEDGSKGQATPVAVGNSEISATRNTVSGVSTLTVTDAVLEEITVTPASASVAAGHTQQYTATARYSDDSTQDVTKTVSWSADDPSVTISNATDSEGLATTTAGAAGKQIKISAAIGDISSNMAELLVTNAVLESIAISTQPVDITETAAGTELQFIATGTFSDGSTSDLTTAVSWSVIEETPTVNEANVGNISNDTGSKGLLSTFSPGTIKVGASSDSINAERDLLVTDAILTGLSVSPESIAIPLNNQHQFTATAHYSDDSRVDVTSAADTVWSSSKTDIATVDNAGQKGLAISQGASGTTEITANYFDQSAFGSLTVDPATLVSISIKDLSNLPVGASRPLEATGHYSDSSTQDITSQVTWSSFSGNAVVSNASGSRGLVTGVSEGSEVISARLDGVSVSGNLVVSQAALASIELSPADSSASGNSSVQYTATGIYTDSSSVDLTSQVTWASSNTNVATISNAEGSKGLAQTQFQFVATTTNITAFHAGSNTTGTTSLTVTAF